MADHHLSILFGRLFSGLKRKVLSFFRFCTYYLVIRNMLKLVSTICVHVIFPNHIKFFYIPNS